MRTVYQYVLPSFSLELLQERIGAISRTVICEVGVFGTSAEGSSYLHWLKLFFVSWLVC